MKFKEFLNNDLTEEKWIKIDPAKKGMFDGWTLDKLKREYKKLKAKGPHARGSKALKLMHEMMFAIRAKIGHGFRNSVTENIEDDQSEVVGEFDKLMKKYKSKLNSALVKKLQREFDDANDLFNSDYSEFPDEDDESQERLEAHIERMQDILDELKHHVSELHEAVTETVGHPAVVRDHLKNIDDAKRDYRRSRDALIHHLGDKNGVDFTDKDGSAVFRTMKALYDQAFEEGYKAGASHNP
jgi:hypothetical protein